MKRLEKKIQQIIKKKRFACNSIVEENNGHTTGGVDITYRIQRIGTEYESWCDNETPLTVRGGHIYVNIVVSGKAETRERCSRETILKPIEVVAKKRRYDYYDWNPLWGGEYHKRIRKHIRDEVETEIANYLKLFGMTMSINWRGKKSVKIKNISWGKV